MDNSKISIITVVYNGVATLEQTMISVLNQTYNNIEYIIVDGASTDGTVDIISNYELRIKNVEFPNIFFRYISEPDKGIYDAMNKGIDMATGEWLNFMNAGDIFCDSDVLEKIANTYFLSDNSKAFLYSDYYVKNEFSNPDKTLFAASYKNGNILHQSVIYKRDLHKTHGYYIVTDKIIVSDYLFFNFIDMNVVEKINIPISINDMAGVSTGSWCYKQKICVDYIFGRITFFYMLKTICLSSIKNFCKVLLGKKTTNLILNSKYKKKAKSYSLYI